MQSTTVKTEYPSWVMAIGLSMIVAGVLPMPIVYFLRRFQILKVDLDIHQGSIRRNETTASTKQMMDDDDVSACPLINLYISIYSIYIYIESFVLVVKCIITKENVLTKSITNLISFLVFNAC